MGYQYDLIIYRKLTNPYVRFVRVNDGFIWDVANEELAAAPTYGDTDVQLTADNTSIGGTPIKVPSLLPAGDYDMLIYDAATPAVTDEVLIGKRIGWNGNVIAHLPIDL